MSVRWTGVEDQRPGGGAASVSGEVHERCAFPAAGSPQFSDRGGEHHADMTAQWAPVRSNRGSAAIRRRRPRCGYCGAASRSLLWALVHRVVGCR